MVHPLRSLSSAELFFKNCGDLDLDDVVDFILEDKMYPLTKIIPDTVHRLSTIQRCNILELKQQLKWNLNSNDMIIKALSEHDMFRQIQGNPTSITLMAAINSNEMIKREDQNTLIDIYRRITSEKDIVVEQLGHDEDMQAKKVYHRTYKNTMSLKITTEICITQLKQTFPKAMNLLCLLCCMPGGVKESQIKELDSDDFTETLEHLRDYNLLETGVQKQVLTPVVLHYC